MVALFLLVPFVSGDARLAKNVNNKVFSFDLVSSDPSVIACDMSKVCKLQSGALSYPYNTRSIEF